MGGMWFADENGEFEKAIRDGQGNVLAHVHLTDLEPGQELYRDLLKGRDR